MNDNEIKNIFPNKYTNYWKTCSEENQPTAIKLAEEYLLKARQLIDEARDICMGNYNNMSEFDYATEKLNKCFYWIDKIQKELKEKNK